METAAHEGPLWIGSSAGDARLLADALGCTCRLDVPDAAAEPAVLDAWAQRLERWRSDGHLVRHAQVVVAAFDGTGAHATLTATTAEQWRRRLEMPFMLGFAALQTAAACCADGGAVVVVTNDPEPLDAAGHAPAVAVAEGLQTAALSLALAERRRGIRVNVVRATAGATAGRASRELAGAVRALLGADAVGLTGQVLRASAGLAP
jgi:hypothetical protein